MVIKLTTDKRFPVVILSAESFIVELRTLLFAEGQFCFIASLSDRLFQLRRKQKNTWQQIRAFFYGKGRVGREKKEQKAED